jgi:ABC-type lipoprotein export system ATPase subunit
VLIDEIENAGVDRDKALELLIREEKIVILVTHDPELALLASRRLVIRDGGMSELLNRSSSELALLGQLKVYSAKLNALRQAMRNGSEMNEDIELISDFNEMAG